MGRDKGPKANLAMVEHVYLWLCAQEYRYRQRPRVSNSLERESHRCCEQLDVGPGNQTKVLGRSSEYP